MYRKLWRKKRLLGFRSPICSIVAHSSQKSSTNSFCEKNQCWKKVILGAPQKGQMTVVHAKKALWEYAVFLFCLWVACDVFSWCMIAMKVQLPTSPMLWVWLRGIMLKSARKLLGWRNSITIYMGENLWIMTDQTLLLGLFAKNTPTTQLMPPFNIQYCSGKLRGHSIEPFVVIHSWITDSPGAGRCVQMRKTGKSKNSGMSSVKVK